MMKKRKLKTGPPKGTKFGEIKRTPFGERLYKILQTKKITQRELAGEIGITNRMVSYYETNEMGPPLKILRSIANVLGVTISYLADESPLKITTISDINPSLKMDIEILKTLPKKDQRTVSNTIAGLKAKQQLQENNKETI
jgi:transcriptional regulator with XRE-family HTH domain